MAKPRVALFITCLADQFFPQVGECVVNILRRLDVEVTFNPEQTCCGQPAFNTGYRQEARSVARRVLELYDNADYVVAPSGSCTSMVRVFYPELFQDDPELLRQCQDLKKRFFEFSEFLVEVLKVEDVGARFAHRVTYHDSCHLLRELGVEQAPRKLLSKVQGIDLVEMDDHQLCCGFGGTFAVKFPEVSVPMGQDKIRAATATGAEYLVAADGSCLMHLAGLIHRQRMALKTLHLAEVLAKQER
ncbi:MAG TPA: (Fe-S)-binding protein [Terriglobia bacterium]|nr:(Fe-S)-binding protein [Terriglobia bacterium]